MLNRGEAAGVIIMGENVASPDQLRALTDFFRESSPLTPIISIDQEGGKVAVAVVISDRDMLRMSGADVLLAQVFRPPDKR